MGVFLFFFLLKTFFLLLDRWSWSDLHAAIFNLRPFSIYTVQNYHVMSQVKEGSQVQESRRAHRERQNTFIYITLYKHFTSCMGWALKKQGFSFFRKAVSNTNCSRANDDACSPYT